MTENYPDAMTACATEYEKFEDESQYNASLKDAFRKGFYAGANYVLQKDHPLPSELSVRLDCHDSK